MGNGGEMRGSSGGDRGLLRFGTFAIDEGRRQLTRESVEIHLTPKAFDLLALLASEAPRVLTKTELHERLWPATYVSDATLVGLVKEVRHALDDRDADHPIIRTAHRVGYAFNAAIATEPARRPTLPSHWLVLRGRRVGLHDGDNVIGRDPGADIWLDVAGVSRRHARLVVSSDGVRVEDLGSKNGTKVDEAAIDRAVVLGDGARLSFGPVEAVYRRSPAGMSTETQSRRETVFGPGPRS